MSFGNAARAALRTTDQSPTKSAILGMIACAQGIERDDQAHHQRLANTIKMACVQLQLEGASVSPPPLRDYHLIRCFKGYVTTRQEELDPQSPKTDSLTSERYYLQDQTWVVLLQVPDEDVDGIIAALQRPYWPIYFGRKSCPPSAPLNPRVLQSTTPRECLEEAVASSFYYLDRTVVPGQVFWDEDFGLEGSRRSTFRRDVPHDLTRQGSHKVRREFSAHMHTL
jgi:CRISPR system Cascade subunit CasD